MVNASGDDRSMYHSNDRTCSDPNGDNVRSNMNTCENDIHNNNASKKASRVSNKQGNNCNTRANAIQRMWVNTLPLQLARQLPDK